MNICLKKMSVYKMALPLNFLYESKSWMSKKYKNKRHAVEMEYYRVLSWIGILQYFNYFDDVDGIFIKFVDDTNWIK